MRALFSGPAKRVVGNYADRHAGIAEILAKLHRMESDNRLVRRVASSENVTRLLVDICRFRFVNIYSTTGELDKVAYSIEWSPNGYRIDPDPSVSASFLAKLYCVYGLYSGDISSDAVEGDDDQ